MRPSFFQHLHPPSIPARQARLRYTLGAGGLSVFLTLVVIATGALELFYYLPTVDGAALSLQTMTYHVWFGGLVRSLHYWSAQLLVVSMLVHLLRVVLTGSVTRGRRFNYLLGLALLVLVFLLDFTGYALRWDESIRWALVAGTNLVKTIPFAGPALYLWVMGEAEPGQATLLRFYAWHIFGLTLIFTVLTIWHLFRLRRDGGIAVPPPEARVDKSRISRAELVRREGLAVLLGSALLLLLAIGFPPALGAPMLPGSQQSGQVLAPWFFLWIQQLLKLGDPFLFGVLLPAFVLILISALPFIFPIRVSSLTGQWFSAPARPASLVLGMVFIALATLTIFSLLPAAP